MHAHPNFWHFVGQGQVLGNGHFLILGGTRSGKTALAEKLCLSLSSNPAYIATAQPKDKEMGQRIAKHQQQRSKNFTTFEEPLALGEAIERAAKNHDVILVDCLTLWLSNLSFSSNVDRDIPIEKLKNLLANQGSSQIILVSNEVGMGIIPDNKLARDFGDQSGILHQQLARICENTCLVVAGLPMMLKGKLPDLL